MTGRAVVLRTAGPYPDVTASEKGSPEVIPSGTETTDKPMYVYGRHPLKSAGTDDCETASPRCKNRRVWAASDRPNRQPAAILAAGHTHILGSLPVRGGPKTGGSGSLDWRHTHGGAKLAGEDLQGSSARTGGVAA